MKKAPNLNEDEIKFFYNLLYLLERRTRYKGFNIQLVDPKIKKTIILNSDFGKNEFVPKPLGNNILNFRGKSGKTMQLLKHIRNSFAHGLLESRGNLFYILDVPKGEKFQKDLEANASMIGTVEKNMFYGMIEELINKNQLYK